MMVSAHEIFALNSRYIEAIFAHCRGEGWKNILLFIDAFILIAGAAANVALLWLFLRERKLLSASTVLGMNLVAMDLIYLSIMPVSLIHRALFDDRVKRNLSDFSATAWNRQNITLDAMEMTRGIFSIFNLIGCPLLLACMCAERYVAVIKPVLYMKMRKWEYRMAVSAVVWVFTMIVCVATILLQDLAIMMLPVSFIISCLFILMLFCLGGVVWSLQQQSPALTTCGNQARPESPLKRQAVGNVLVVVVPAVIAYLPVLMIIPMLLYMFSRSLSLNKIMCDVIEVSVISPMFGVFIGPFFYFSKARQMCCLSGTRKKRNG